MALTEAETLDDFIHQANEIVDKLDGILSKSGSEEKLAKLIVEANDPDSRFKAKIITQMMGIVEKLKLVGRYLNQPVKMEGVLQRKLDGTVHLNDTVLANRSIVEFVQNSEWNIGVLIQDPKTKQYQIHDMVNTDKVLVEKIEQVQARVRLIK